jgi:hypothetical protein
MYDDENELSFYDVWLENYSKRAKRNYANWLAQQVDESDESDDDDGVHYFR